MGVVEVEQARTAFGRGDWDVAFEGWSAADADALGPGGLEDLATAAELLGRHDEAVRALQQAFTRYQQSGDLALAVRVAFRLAMTTATHGEMAMSAGWTSRAEGLVAELGDVPERGWVAFLRMFRALGMGAYAEASAAADEAAEIGRRHQDPDLTALGLCSQGRLALYSGRVADGLALLDEAMVRVIAGETMPIIAGHVYCTAIEGCQEISDFGRMAEWTSALERWCAAQPGLLAFTGQCAVHRGQLMRLHGEWSAALDEFALASQRYEQVGSPDAAGLAAYEAGDVHRLRGEWDAGRRGVPRPPPTTASTRSPASRCCGWRAVGPRRHATPSTGCWPSPEARSSGAGCCPPPSTCSWRRATSTGRGRPRPSSRRWPSPSAAWPWTRWPPRRREPSSWPRGTPPAPSPTCARRTCCGPGPSRPSNGRAPRLLTGRALAAVGDLESSRRELEAARSTFRQLGAQPAADEVSALLAPPALPAGLTAREVEVLRLVASGRSNAQIAADLVLSEKTVARHLSNIFTKLDVGSRTAATAYAFENKLV